MNIVEIYFMCMSYKTHTDYLFGKPVVTMVFGISLWPIQLFIINITNFIIMFLKSFSLDKMNNLKFIQIKQKRN